MKQLLTITKKVKSSDVIGRTENITGISILKQFQFYPFYANYYTIPHNYATNPDITLFKYIKDGRTTMN